jgi:hypothetical protein
MTDASAITGPTDEPAAGAESTASHRLRLPRTHSPHARRFRAAVVILGGLALAAVVGAILIASHGRSTSSGSPALPWSLWRPTDSGTQGAREIANYVGPNYVASPAVQLAVVTVVDTASATAEQAAAQAQANGTTAARVAGTQIAVRPNLASSQMSLLGGNPVAYNLCGINDSAKNCMIGVGTPSSNRLLLLRREALELALYTFKYIRSTNNVVVLLPPGRAQATSTSANGLPVRGRSSASSGVDIAVLFQRQELAPLLAHPIYLLLPGQLPPTVAQMPKASEASLVRQATARGLFSEQLQQAQDGSNVMVLAPLPAQ